MRYVAYDVHDKYRPSGAVNDDGSDDADVF